MLVEAFFSTLVSFCLVQLLHNTADFDRTFFLLKKFYSLKYIIFLV